MRGIHARSANGFVFAVVLTAAAVLLWGFAHRLFATLLPGLGQALSLTPAQADMARSAVAIGYFLMTLPTVFISRNFGYKIGMLFGLGTFAVGIFLLYPAVSGHSILFFIAAATVFGSGLAMVEVTAMPLVVFLGSRDGAIQRTVLVAALAPLGALAALFAGQNTLAGATIAPGFATSLITLLSSVGVAAIALAFVMEMIEFPPVATARVAQTDRTLPSFLKPLRIGRFRYAMAASFLCLFAEIVIASFAPLYSLTVVPSLTPMAAQLVLASAYLALLIGRLVGPLLMVRIAPLYLLVISSAATTLCAGIAVAASGPFAIACLVGTCFFMAILFPTIFADALRDLGDTAKSAAALLLFVAFSGTGLFAWLAVVSTPFGVRPIMVLPALCFAGVTVLSHLLRRSENAVHQPIVEPSIPTGG